MNSVSASTTNLKEEPDLKTGESRILDLLLLNNKKLETLLSKNIDTQYTIIEGSISDLNDETLEILKQHHENFKNLEEMDISSNNISYNGITDLCELLIHTPNLQILNLSNLRNVSFQEFVIIGKILPKLKNLKEIKLYSYIEYGIHIKELREFITNANKRENVLTIHLPGKFIEAQSSFFNNERQIKIEYS
jgi:hypothetical protein